MAGRIQQGLRAVRGLSLHLASSLLQQAGGEGAVESALAMLGRHRGRLLGGVVGGAGAAGGAWAAVSVWSGSLGMWGGVAAAFGMAAAPLWVPFAGGLAGLTAAGGAAAGLRALARSRDRRRYLQSIIGLSKMLLEGETFGDADERVMRGFLRARQVKEDEVEGLLRTTPETGRRVALEHLSRGDRREVARFVYPLVYAGDGVITPAERRRFGRVCAALELPPEEAGTISRQYRRRLEEQWAYLRGLIGRLTYFAEALAFDSREMELLRRELEQLMAFDPRRTAIERRRRTLQLLGADGAQVLPIGGEAGDEAVVMGAYALAHTAVAKPHLRRRLQEVFDRLLESESGLSPSRRLKLRQNRQKVDRLYRATFRGAAAQA
ncbi:MAG: hypothetical protein ABIL09_00605 [Gemmatimonadota bacterium]